MADKRISGLTAMTTISKDDILLVVDDPAGTPTNKKISIEKFFSNVEPQVVFANITAASNSTIGSVTFRGGVGVSKNLIIDGNVSVNGVFTLSGNGSITNLSSNLTPDTTISYDLGNSTSSWKDAYIQKLPGHIGALEISANATLSANLTTSGSNVYINGTDFTVDANTTIKANLIVHSDSTNTVIKSGNTHITSNTLLAGTNTVISSNISSSANLTQTGALSLFNGANLTSNANATFFGNVALGVTSGGGNPKGSDTVLVSIGATNTSITSNTTLAGTNTVISSNLTSSGANSYVTSNTTLAGTNTVISSNVTISSANVYINPSGTANLYLKGMLTTTGNTSLGDDLTVAGNLHVSDTTDSTLGDDGLTGSIRTLGGMGITKNLTVGQNLNVHGNIHANGNITADGGTVRLGDSASDTVQFNADLGSHLIPSADSTYDLGTTSDRYRFLYVDDILTTGNVNASGDMTASGNVSGLFGNFTDNVKISTDKSLQLRDDTEYIHSNADGEISIISGSKVTITTTSLNTSANTTLAGETANVTANLFISGANTRISSANTTIDATKTTIAGTDLVVTANTTLPQFTSNTILVTTGANTNLGGSVNISGNVEMSGTANVAGNVFIGGNTILGTTSAGVSMTYHANGDILLNSNGTSEFVKLDTKKNELFSNVNFDIEKPIIAGNNVYLKEDTSLIFGGQFEVNNDTSMQTIVVTVANPGSGNKFYFDGVLGATIDLIEGVTYRFDVSDNTNDTHLLAFSSTNPDSSTTAYTTGVTTSGTAGTSDAYVQIVVASGAKDAVGVLYPYCTAHSGMHGSNLQISDSTEGNLLLEDGTTTYSGTDNGNFLLEDLASSRISSNASGFIFGGDIILDETEIVSANGVVNLGTYEGLANGVIRISDAYNLPNTAGSNGQFLRLINGNVVFASGSGTNMTDLVDDLSPQLGGILDIGSHHITSDSFANVTIAGNTTVSSSAGIKLGKSATTYVFVKESNGRLGINTTNPSASLDVAGTMLVSNETTFNGDLNINNHNGNDVGLKLGSTLVTANADELNKLDGFTGDVADFNKLSGTSDTLAPADLDAIENFEETVSATTSEVTIKSDKNLNIAGHDLVDNGLKLGGTLVTASAGEINRLDGLNTAITTEVLNKLQIASDSNGLLAGKTQAGRFIHVDDNNNIDFTYIDSSNNPGQIKVANVVISGTQTSSSNTTGALKVTGGAGIAKSTTIGQKLTVFGNTTFNANVTISGPASEGSEILYDKTNDSLNMKIRVVGIGTTNLANTVGGIGTEANNVLVFSDGVAPSSQPDSQAYLYAKNVSGGADDGQTHLFTMDEGGNETQLGPHNNDNEWEFYSRNVKTGKVIRINMERMIKKLEKFTGETFIEYE